MAFERFDDAHEERAAHAYLAQAAELGEPLLFEDYVAWSKVVRASRGSDPRQLLRFLEELRRQIADRGDGPSAAALPVLEGALERFDTMPESAPGAIRPEGSALDAVALGYLGAILRGNRRDADRLVRDAVDAGASIEDVYLQVFEPVQHEIGRLWQTNRIDVAQEHLCTAAVQRSMSMLYPSFLSGAPGRPRVVAACAGGELHELGLRMVADLLELNGWDSIYLGANVPGEGIVARVAAAPTALVALSATLAPNLRALREVIAALRADPATATVPILVGGYPFTLVPGLAAKLGADGSASSARDAVRRAAEMTETVTKR